MTTLRKWPKISKTLATNATNKGLIEVDDIAGLYLFQRVSMKSDVAVENINLMVIEILSNTVVRLGEFSNEKKKILVDLSAFVTADNSLVFAPLQRMSDVDYKTIMQETFERFPTSAWRVEQVDSKGNLISISNPLPVQTGDGINIQKVNRLSVINSTSSALSNDETFTGVFEECLGWSTISVIVKSDQDSTVNGLIIEYSSDGTNIDDSISFTILADTGKTYTFGTKSRFYRIRYTNNTIPQGFLRLQTILHVDPPKYSTHRIGGTIDSEDDAQLVKAVPELRDPNGIFKNDTMSGRVSSATTSTPLGSSEVFQSPILDLTQHTNTAVSIKTDQPGTFIGEWYADAAATQLIRTFSFSYSGDNLDLKQSSPKFAEYLIIKYINGSVAQTTFNLQFWQHIAPLGGQVSPIEAFFPTNILSPINRSVITGRDPFGVYNNVGVTNFSHLNMAINDANSGAPAFIAPNGAVNVAEIFRLVGGNFISGEPLLSHIWTETLINSGITETTDGELIMSTDGAADGEVRVQSFRKSRFITATFNLSHQAVATPNRSNSDVIRRWGIFNPDDAVQQGAFFENDSGTIRIVRMKNDVRVEVVELADFNGQDTFVFNDDVGVYEIVYNAGTLFFLQNRKLIHRMVSLTDAAYGTPHLRVGHLIQNINGNTTVNSMITRGSSISRIGANSAIPDFFDINTASTNIIKNGPGRIHRLIITDKGIGSATVTLFNNVGASGEVIATVDTADVSGSVEFNVEFDEGLTVVAAGASVSIVIIYD